MGDYWARRAQREAGKLGKPPLSCWYGFEFLLFPVLRFYPFLPFLPIDIYSRQSLRHPSFDSKIPSDTSIWLNHFIKAMRDKKGNMVANAHIKGLFSRICKMLYFGVRPVFVFDGATPILKKNTTARRQRAKESSAKKVQQLAEKILLNQLKLDSLKELKKSIAQGDKSAAKRLLERLTSQGSEEALVIGDDDDEEEEIIVDDLPEDNTEEIGSIPMSQFIDQGEFAGLFGSEDEQDGFAILAAKSNDDGGVVVIDDSSDAGGDAGDDSLDEDIELAAVSILSQEQLRDLNIDSESFQALPDDVKREILSQLQNLRAVQRRSRVRQMLMEGDLEKRPDPNAFSDLQLQGLIQRSRVTRKIQELTSTLSGNAERPIASSATGRYILRRESGAGLSNTLHRPDGTIVRLRSDGSVERVSSGRLSEGASILGDDDVVVSQILPQDPTRSGPFSATPKRLSLSSQSSGIDRRLSSIPQFSDDEGEDDVHHQEVEDAMDIDDQSKSDDGELPPTRHVSRNPTSGQLDASSDAVEIVGEIEKPPAGSVLEIRFEIGEEDEGAEGVAKKIDFDSFVEGSAETPAVSRASSVLLVRKQTSALIPNEVIDRDEEFGDVEFETIDSHSLEANTLRRTARSPAVDVQEISDTPCDVAPSVREFVPPDAAPAVPEAQAGSDRPAPPAVAPSTEVPTSPLADRDGTSIEGLVEDISSLHQQASSTLVAAPPPAPLPNSTAPYHTEPSSERGIDDSVNDSISSVLLVASQSAAGPSEKIGAQLDELNQSVTSNLSDIWPEKVENVERELQLEASRMQDERRTQAGQAQGVTNEMVEDCKELLRLFGVPYVESPGEADAQCAILEQLNLVDGIVSDDSDIFLFGGMNVFRHAFDRRYHLELFAMKGASWFFPAPVWSHSGSVQTLNLP